MSRQRLYYIIMPVVFIGLWLMLLQHSYRKSVKNEWNQIAAPWAGPMPDDADANKINGTPLYFIFDNPERREQILQKLSMVPITADELRDNEFRIWPGVRQVYRTQAPITEEDKRESGYYDRSYPVLISLINGECIYYHEDCSSFATDEDSPVLSTPNYPEYVGASYDLDIITLLISSFFITILPPILCIAPRLWFTRGKRTPFSPATLILCLVLPIALCALAIDLSRIYPEGLLMVPQTFHACNLCAVCVLTLYSISTIIIYLSRLIRKKA